VSYGSDRLIAQAERGPELSEALENLGRELGAGVGQQVGPLRTDWGPDWADLQCPICDASWVGRIGSLCYWCCKSLANMIQWQREAVLTPPDMELGDKRRPNALLAWGKRLKVQVDAGNITKEEAERVYKRELGRTQ